MISIIEFDKKYSQDTLDLVTNIRINELGWPMDSPDQDDLRDIRKYYLKDKGNFWIALDNSRVVGTIGLEDAGCQQGFLKRMYVIEKYRGTGLASKLVDHLLSFAKANGYSEIYLTSANEAQRAISFYRKYGFTEIDHLPERLFQHPDATICFKIEI